MLQCNIVIDGLGRVKSGCTDLYGIVAASAAVRRALCRNAFPRRFRDV